MNQDKLKYIKNYFFEKGKECKVPRLFFNNHITFSLIQEKNLIITCIVENIETGLYLSYNNKNNEYHYMVDGMDLVLSYKSMNFKEIIEKAFSHFYSEILSHYVDKYYLIYKIEEF